MPVAKQFLLDQLFEETALLHNFSRLLRSAIRSAIGLRYSRIRALGCDCRSAYDR
jgi:hypothetical protein